MRLPKLLLFLACPVLHAATCDSLTTVKIPHTAILLAQAIAAGEYAPPDANPRAAALYKKLPAFCRVSADATPTADSHILFEVWLPAAGWNGKLQAEGNGGFAGSIAFDLMAASLARGYVVTGTDTGHKGTATESGWALNHPEKITDFGYRGIHEMTLGAKALTEAFYGKMPTRSYFVGCSDGGREALMEAQRFPADYDGILAGAPANNWTRMLSSGVDLAAAMGRDEASYIPSTKIPAIAKAVLAACDAKDGVTDGVVNDPTKCGFDPAVLTCSATETEACLTAPQIRMLKKIYAGGQTSKGVSIFPGLQPGGEEGPGGWQQWVLGPRRDKGEGSSYVNGFFQNMVYNDPSWKPGNVDQAMQTADEKLARDLNATDPDLTPFQKHGGKLILYHGWNDPAISPLNSIAYYNAVLAAMTPAKATQFLRLYMVPGMQHCYGGPGATAFGQFASVPGTMYQSLEDWVEKGAAPASVKATKLAPPVMTRPLCPYPQSAKYNGSGDTNDAVNFTCTAP